MRKVTKLRKKETTNKTNLHELSGFAAALPGGCFAIFRNLREAHDRTTARWPTAPWMLARASAKRVISHESHHLARCSKWAHLHFSSASAAQKPCKCALARSTAKPLSHTWKVASRNGVVRDRMALFYNDFEEFVFPNGLFDCKGCLRGTDACENKIGWAWCYLCPSSIQGLTCHQFCGAT